MNSKELERAVLALPRDERAALVHDVLLSLDAGHEDEADQAWLAELDRRAGEVASGSAKLVDWEDARNRIAQRLRAARATPAAR